MAKKKLPKRKKQIIAKEKGGKRNQKQNKTKKTATTKDVESQGEKRALKICPKLIRKTC